MKNKIGYVKILGIVAMVLAISALVYAVTATNSPTSCSGGWTSCSNANADDASRATAAVTATTNVTGTWTGFGYALKDSAIITNVTARLDFFASKASGFAVVRVSSDGGSSYGPAHVIGGNTAEQTYNVDVTSETAWTASKLNNSNLKVQVTCYKSGGGSNPTCSLDWAPVIVKYTPFDFFVYTTSNNATVSQGGSVQTTLVASKTGGTAQTVNLNVIHCPTDATCTLDVNSGTPTYNTTFTVQPAVTTPLGVYNINVTGTGDGLSRTTTYTVSVV